MISLVVNITIKCKGLGWAGHYTKVATLTFFVVDNNCSSDFCHLFLMFIRCSLFGYLSGLFVSPVKQGNLYEIFSDEFQDRRIVIFLHLIHRLLNLLLYYRYCLRKLHLLRNKVICAIKWLLTSRDNQL